MRKLCALALALLLLLTPVLAAAEEPSAEASGEPAGFADVSGDAAQAESEPEEEAESEPEAQSEAEPEATPEPVDPGAVAAGAAPLYALIARALTLGAAPFDGEPDADTAWALTYAAMEQGAVEGLSEGRATREDVEAAYGALFASGTLPEKPASFTLLALEDGGYSQTSDPGDIGFEAHALGGVEADGLVTAEAAVMMRTSYAPADLSALISVSLAPDAAAPFGARLAGFQPITGAPAMTAADATSALEAYKGITYTASNALDGDNDTCWAYSEDETPGAVITLNAAEPQTVRGIRLTPAYAKSNHIALANNRVKSFHVELSDGAAYDFTVEPDIEPDRFTRFASFAFDAAHEVTWVSVQVTAVYPGDKYTDTCVSEIALF